MTTESMKEGEALPDARVAELTERLEQAKTVIEQIQHDLHTAKIWGGMKWDYVPLRQQLVEQIDKRCAAFLAAHQEPKP